MTPLIEYLADIAAAVLPSAQGSPVQQQEAACFSHPGPTTADWWKVTAYHHQCPDLAPAATKVATSAINILENKCHMPKFLAFSEMTMENIYIQ